MGSTSKHHVELAEVLEALEEPWIRRGPGNRYLAYGQTAAGRYLFIALSLRRGGVGQILSARVMNDAERRRYQNR